MALCNPMSPPRFPTVRFVFSQRFYDAALECSSIRSSTPPNGHTFVIEPAVLTFGDPVINYVFIDGALTTPRLSCIASPSLRSCEPFPVALEAFMYVVVVHYERIPCDFAAV